MAKERRKTKHARMAREHVVHETIKQNVEAYPLTDE